MKNVYAILFVLLTSGCASMPPPKMEAAPTSVRHQGDTMKVKRMDNVGIVVKDIDAAIEFFTELGLTLEGRMPIDAEWAGRVTGVFGQQTSRENPMDRKR